VAVTASTIDCNSHRVFGFTTDPPHPRPAVNIAHLFYAQITLGAVSHPLYRHPARLRKIQFLICLDAPLLTT
jgi:hypothetical protein